MVIPVLLVFLGFFAVFYSSVIDLFTTYLPEDLVRLSLPAGLVGWALHSFLSGSYAPLLTSVRMTAFSLLAGGALYLTKRWASGDLWLMGVASSLLSPAFPRFWPDFFVYSAFWMGVLGTAYYFYYLFSSGLYRKYGWHLVVFAAAEAWLLTDPLVNAPLIALVLMALVLFTREDVDALFIHEKPVRELEEDDWLLEDVELDGGHLDASRPVGKREARLAREKGEGTVRVKSGVPMTPAFSLALVTLLLTA